FLNKVGYFDNNYLIENIYLSNSPSLEDIESHYVLIESNNIEKKDKGRLKVLVIVDFLQNLALILRNKKTLNGDALIDIKDFINSVVLWFKNFVFQKNNVSVLLIGNITRDVIFKLAKANKSINDLDYKSNLMELSDAIFMIDYAYCGYYRDKYDRISLDCDCSGNVEDNDIKIYELLPFIGVDRIKKIQYRFNNKELMYQTF
ncbi:MAG: hypothetical protein QXH07_04810, partial [Thermoplasmata archaeon]